jgi:ribosomal protein L29
MPNKKLMAEIEKKSLKELSEMLEAYQQEYYHLTVKNKVRSLTQTHQIKQKRRDIARISTALTAKKFS